MGLPQMGTPGMAKVWRSFSPSRALSIDDVQAVLARSYQSYLWGCPVNLVASSGPCDGRSITPRADEKRIFALGVMRPNNAFENILSYVDLLYMK